MATRKQDVDYLKKCGFLETDIMEVLPRSQSVKEAYDTLVNLCYPNSAQPQYYQPYAGASASGQSPVPPRAKPAIAGATEEDIEMSRAIAQSLEDQHEPPERALAKQASPLKFYDPQDFDTPEERVRKEGMPVGLVNIGNTCYFNSLLQTYFMMPMFVEQMMKFVPAPEKKDEGEPRSAEVKQFEERRKASIKLVQEVQKTFAFMLASNRKYIRPDALINAIVDESGVPLSIGDQKDVGEFNLNFLARIEEAMLPLQKALENSISLGLGGSLGSQYMPSGRKLAPLRREESFISRTFFGTLMVITRAIEKDNMPIELKDENSFAQIMINANEKTVYQGWESGFFTEIENFVTPRGTKTTAQQECWITQLPTVLFLQMQRVFFDRDEQRAKKITNPVKFDKVLYADRFLEQNREKTMGKQSHVVSLQKELAAKEQLLAQFNRFGQKRLGLVDAIDTTIEFLGFQARPGEEKENKSAFRIEGIGDKSVREATELLAKYSVQTKEKIEKLKREIEGIKEKIERCYDDMQEHPYVLHSILAHSGVPESGHYYAYIYDFEKEKWHRYNDNLVTEEDEATIFCPPVDIDDLSSVQSYAYCLIYMDKAAADSMRSGLKSKLVPSAKKGLSEYYHSLLSPSLSALVKDDNVKFDLEVMDYRAKQLVNKISGAYNDRIQLLLDLKKQLGYEAYNFACYLYFIRNELYKWVLLNSTVRELHEAQIGLETLDFQDPLILHLSQQLGTSKAPLSSLILSKHDKKSLEGAKDPFLRTAADYVMQRYILEKLIAQDWLGAIHALCYYTAQGKGTSSESRRRIGDVLKVLVLRLFSLVNEKLSAKDVKSALHFVDIIAQLCISYIPKGDPHTKLVIRLLNSVFSNVKTVMSPEQFAMAEGCIKKIVEFPLFYKGVLLQTSCPPELQSAVDSKVKDETIWEWNKKSLEELQAGSLDKLMANFMNRYTVWLKWHRTVSRNVRELTVDEVYEDEKNAGIDYFKALANEQDKP